MIAAERDDLYVLNHCTKYLARDSTDPRHDFLGAFAGAPRAAYADCWRFPIVDASAKGPDWNDVTFVYIAVPGIQEVKLVATLERICDPIPLRRVGETRYFAASLVVPRMRRYRYKFLVGGGVQLDPINPQSETLAVGDVWSSFFTWSYNQPITFERWEMAILDRLTRHILPFNTPEGQNYLERHASDKTDGLLYRLDASVGVANFIDKILAKEERHRLYAYRTCIEMIDQLLRNRNPGRDPEFLEEGQYVRLYEEMAKSPQALFNDGWNQARYGSPLHFLSLLRRHSVLGAFSHPKYGGNPTAASWGYLAERYPFDWEQAIEPPLGASQEYRG